MGAILPRASPLRYRGRHVLLKWERCPISHKKLLRLYREEKLTARCRGDGKRAIETRALMLIPMAPNEPGRSTDRQPPLPRPHCKSTIVPASAWRWCPTSRSPHPCCAGTELPDDRARQAGDGSQRQRQHQQRHPDMGRCWYASNGTINCYGATR